LEQEEARGSDSSERRKLEEVIAVSSDSSGEETRDQGPWAPNKYFNWCISAPKGNFINIISVIYLLSI
jgi:hypothetical protein